jgi:DNA-binding beta-propeller fold protein YncE
VGQQRDSQVTAAGVVSTLAGTGTAGFANGPDASATFNGPNGVAVDSAGNVYVADRDNIALRKITP